MAFTLRVEAAASTGCRKYDPPPAAVWGLNRKATRVSSGAMSLSNSTHLPVIEDSKLVNPVTLPPGRAKLATKPSPTGSDIDTNTIGMLRVCPSRVATTGLEWATITSGRNSTSSLANFHTSTGSSGAQRYSIPRLLPSSHPSPRSPRCNAATLDRACESRAASSIKTPIRRTRLSCCARAASGHRPAKQRDELAPLHVEHGASFPSVASLVARCVHALAFRLERRPIEA